FTDSGDIAHDGHGNSIDPALRLKRAKEGRILVDQGRALESAIMVSRRIATTGIQDAFAQTGLDSLLHRCTRRSNTDCCPTEHSDWRLSQNHRQRPDPIDFYR